MASTFASPRLSSFYIRRSSAQRPLDVRLDTLVQFLPQSVDEVGIAVIGLAILYRNIIPRIVLQRLHAEHPEDYLIHLPDGHLAVVHVNDNVKVYQKIIQKYTTSTECCKGTKSLLYITYC